MEKHWVWGLVIRFEKSIFNWDRFPCNVAGFSFAQTVLRSGFILSACQRGQSKRRQWYSYGTCRNRQEVFPMNMNQLRNLKDLIDFSAEMYGEKIAIRTKQKKGDH